MPRIYNDYYKEWLFYCDPKDTININFKAEPVIAMEILHTNNNNIVDDHQMIVENLKQALQDIINISSTKEVLVYEGDHNGNFDDIWYWGVERGLWEAAEIAKEALNE